MSMWHYCATLLKSTLLNKRISGGSEILAKWSQGYMPTLLLKNHVPICTIKKCYAQKCLYQCGFGKKSPFCAPSRKGVCNLRSGRRKSFLKRVTQLHTFSDIGRLLFLELCSMLLTQKCLKVSFWVVFTSGQFSGKRAWTPFSKKKKPRTYRYTSSEDDKSKFPRPK